MGVMACVAWCTSVAVIRYLAQDLGPFVAAVLQLGLAGGIGIARSLILRQFRNDLTGLSWSYLLACGSCFIICQVCLLLAIGLAAGGPQVIVVGMLNYFWPALTLALSVVILGHRWNGWLIPGLLVTIAGEAMVVGGPLLVANGEGLSISTRDAIPYTLAAIAALSWALFSNLARRLAGNQSGNAVPLFMCISACVMAPFALLFPFTLKFSAMTGLALAFSVFLPGLLAYTWWDRGMRMGNIKGLTIVSYLIPLGSTLTTSLMLRTLPDWPVWIGAVVVIAGAGICHYAVGSSSEPAEHTATAATLAKREPVKGI